MQNQKCKYKQSQKSQVTTRLAFFASAAHKRWRMRAHTTTAACHCTFTKHTIATDTQTGLLPDSCLGLVALRSLHTTTNNSHAWRCC